MIAGLGRGRRALCAAYANAFAVIGMGLVGLGIAFLGDGVAAAAEFFDGTHPFAVIAAIHIIIQGLAGDTCCFAHVAAIGAVFRCAGMGMDGQHADAQQNSHEKTKKTICQRTHTKFPSRFSMLPL